MMKKSSSSENEPCCSKDCKKNIDSLNSKIEDLKSKLSESDIYRYSYKLEVDQLEGRLAEYREKEVKYIEKIRTLEIYRESNLERIKILTNEVETLKEEKDMVDGNLARLLKSSKDLENIIESQRLSPTIESTLAEGQNKQSTTAENRESTGSILSKLAVKFVKAGDRPTERPTTNKAEFVKAAERPTTNKVETAKKPAVRYAEMYRRTSKRSYGAPMRTSHGPAGHRLHGPPMRPMRSNMNGVKSTSAVRPQYRAPWVPTVNRNFPPVNRKLPTDAASSLGEDCWELDVRSIPTSSAVFLLPVMCSHCRKKFPMLKESSHCQKKFPLVVQNSSHC
nr:hypothetical protein [Tanacetum cinerariifolium]